ncbi:MAG: antibiotic biosynthesis monooxygenase [Candidatus Saccharibacteria bacterium]|nr:antibiotic biosynthesis monooxygenase [Pseudorhodobacter sp.]
MSSALIVRFDIVRDHHGAFLSAVQANAARSVAEEPGCVRFDVLTPLVNRVPRCCCTRFYTDPAAFDHHLTTEHYHDYDAGTRGLVLSKTVTFLAVSENAKT